MKYLPILLLFIFSCKSTKVKETSYEELRKEITYKLDSISLTLSDTKEVEVIQSTQDTIDSEFEVEFKRDEVGQVDVNTPNGEFSVIKKGDGTTTFKGRSKSVVTDNKQVNEKKEVDRLQTKTEETATQDSSRQSGNETKTVKPNTFITILGFIPWWLWMVILLGILFLIFRKAVILYLKNNPFTMWLFRK